MFPKTNKLNTCKLDDSKNLTVKHKRRERSSYSAAGETRQAQPRDSSLQVRHLDVTDVEQDRE